MEFVEAWNEAIEADSYWQFEELLEEDPELADIVWEAMNMVILINNTMIMRHGICLL